MAFVLGGEAWSSAGSEQGKKGLVLRELLLGSILNLGPDKLGDPESSCRSVAVVKGSMLPSWRRHPAEVLCWRRLDSEEFRHSGRGWCLGLTPLAQCGRNYSKTRT